uniref:Uncharacterized protein n=1 Tax=Arundo donax TaxID=35708 RepID=A0A0A9C6Z0_ARUDO
MVRFSHRLLYSCSHKF